MLKNKNSGVNRRRFGKLALATVGAVIASPALGRALPRVVIVGAGVAGATLAKELVSNFKGINVTLIEAQAQYFTQFFANRSLAEFRPLESFTYGYEGIAKDNRLRFMNDTVVSINRDKKSIKLQSGTMLIYDKLVIATGGGMAIAGIEGYDIDATNIMPHAYVGKPQQQWQILTSQLTGMDDGGVFAISVPKRPYRCHPAPYERVSMVAEYLHQNKPKSKILIFDNNNGFPLMDPMQAHWEEKFGEMVEWVSADFGGIVTAVDAKSRTLITEDDQVTVAVANIIPPQGASKLAVISGLASEHGWCPVDPVTFQSTLTPDIHLLGDAIDPGDMPRSAYAANSQAKTCAVAIGKALTGNAHNAPQLRNACYFLLEKDRGLVVGGAYEPVDGRITGIEGYSSELGEEDTIRAKTAADAERWYAGLTKDMFGRSN